MNTWNYRLATYMFSYKKTYPDNPKMWDFKDERMYKIISVYYNKKGEIKGYGEKSDIDGYSSPKEVKNTLKYMKMALKKPILNLDCFPNTFKKKKQK